MSECFCASRSRQFNHKHIIYGEYKRYQISIPTFQDEKVKNLLSPAVNRGDLRPKSRMRRGYILLPSCFGTHGSPSELVLHFLDQSYAPEFNVTVSTRTFNN